MSLDCHAFKYSPSEDHCIVLEGQNASDGIGRDYQLCKKKPLHVVGPSSAPLYTPDEYVEQAQAEIGVGSDILIYAVGSSSLLWMTWVDQLHLLLRRLGYRLPVVKAEAGGRLYPTKVPTCDDTQYFESLQTWRFGRVGWSSWDFAFEGWEGCTEGFRSIEGHRVRCQHGAGCAFSQDPVKASWLAKDASKSNITLIATWFNDDQQWSSNYKCFNGTRHSTQDVAPLTIACLLKTVRSIHAKNPRTWVLIMGKYPQTFHHITYKFIETYNDKIKEAVEKEPRTLFISYYVPSAHEGEFFQVAHAGHPNCRGSKIMAYAVAERLYRERIIARGLRHVGFSKQSILNSSCGELEVAACHSSGFCWVDPADRQCKAYGPGTSAYHTVCAGSVCSEAADGALAY